MPIPKELFDNIRNSNISTIMDMRQGFNQIVLVVNDHKKTTFHGMACDAFQIEECTCLLIVSYGPSSQNSKFLKVLHR
jgi:hypothetical protein